MKTLTLTDDGRVVVWKRPLVVRGLGAVAVVGCVVVAIALAATSGVSDWWVSLVYLGLSAIAGGSLIRPQVRLDGKSLCVVSSFRRERRFDLADVAEAKSGYYGLTFTLADGSLVAVSVGSTANVQRWMGRVSRGDKKAALVSYRAGLARGESPGPIEIRGTRGPGNWSAGFGMAIGLLLRGGR